MQLVAMPAVASATWFSPLFTTLTTLIALVSVVAAVAAAAGSPLFEVQSRGSFASAPLSVFLDVLDFAHENLLKTIFYVNGAIALVTGVHFKLTRKSTRRKKTA